MPAVMNRLEKIKAYVSNFMRDMADPVAREDAAIHLYGVSSACVLLAQRREIDAEIAGICGLLHDIYRYKTGIGLDHAHNGAEMARVVLNRMACFSEDEKKIIISAIFHHGDKQHIHDAYDEVLKDADTMQPFLCGDWRMPSIRAKRLMKAARELNLSMDYAALDVYEPDPKRKLTDNPEKREALAFIAESLAQRQITGERICAEYMYLIRYWPEEEAFDELKCSWCAAFVYHCCQEAGFYLPIRLPNAPCRLAGVAAWNTWARQPDTHFFIKDDMNTVPQRGDIVLYRNIIPPENKSGGSKVNPIDHIGVIIGCDGEHFTVAEGNVNNENQSGILVRPLHQNVEGYIRIDNGYVYDGWKIDYKTGNERIVPFEG